MSDIISFGEWVQTRRNQLRYSRAALAQEVGCAPVTIKKIERDERRPSKQIAELLAIILQIPPDKREDFIRRARGEFVAGFSTPSQMQLNEAEAAPEWENTAHHNLPTENTPFFGRKSELDEITTYLSDQNCRLLTILGTGGMGKTRLALQIGWHYARSQPSALTFSDGVAYVPLAALSATDLGETSNPIFAALADALKLTFYGDQSPEQQLQAHLRGKEMLLIFDNFEHLIDSAEILSELLSHAPNIKLLITSRERLNLQEEWLFPLQGLPFPTKQANDKGSYSAIDLFSQRAKQVQPTFDLETERNAVVRISQLVEGMPLGLELAAAMVRQMPCTAIADEIEKEIGFLGTNLRNIPDRHRSLKAVFAYSWQRLSGAEQNVLQRLTIFRGGFERDAAVAIANASFALLSSLVDKSLLRVTVTGRYAIHELLRQFAAEKLTQSGASKAALRDKHARFYLTFEGDLESLWVASMYGSKGSWLSTKHDIDNIRSAWQWGVTHNWQALLQPAVPALFALHEIQGWFQEGEALFSQAFSQLRASHAKNQFESETDQLQHAVLLGSLLTGAAHCQSRLGQTARALRTFEESVTLFPTVHKLANETALSWTKATCIIYFSNFLMWQGNIARLKDIYDTAEQLLYNAHDSPIYIFMLAGRAQWELYAGQFDDAERSAHESNHLCTEVGNAILPALNMRTLARVAIWRGQYEKAATYLEQSLAMCVNDNLRSQVALRLFELGDVARLQGKHEEAHDYFEQSQSLAIKINMATVSSSVLWGLGNLAESKGDFAAARRYFLESEQISATRLWSPGGLGWVALGLSELDSARTQFRAQLRTNLQFRQAPNALESLAGLAHVQALSGEPEDALSLVTLILNHPASIQESKNRVLPLQARLLAELSVESIATAEARGHSADLWKSAKAILTQTLAS